MNAADSMPTMAAMNWPVIFPELFLLVAACGVLLADLFVTDRERRPTFWLTQASIGVFALMQLAYHNSGTTAYGMQGMVVVDPMGHLLAFFAAVSVMMTLAYARPTLGSRDMLKGEFYTLTLFMLLGISVMCSANNFLVVYLGLELMSLSLYALVALRRDHAVSTEAAMKFFVLGALASGFLLYGLSMMYGATGSLEIPRVFDQIATGRINKEVLFTCGCLTCTRARRRPSRCSSAARQSLLPLPSPSGCWSKACWAWRWTGSRC
jgi:NADH-quinone oxidoreductase subunit N